MGIRIISYSLTGNNEALAASLARALSAPHERLVEERPRTMLMTLLDLWLKRTPKVALEAEGIGEEIAEGDAVVFVAPVWAGMVAAPLRAYLRSLAPRVETYAFVTISGGALGPNGRLADELARRMGKPPAAVADLHIADLLDLGRPATAKDTSAYRVNERDLAALTKAAIDALAPALAKAG